MLRIPEEVKVYLYSGRADMRWSFDRLRALAKEQAKRDPLSGGLYVFLSRSRDRVKILYWERDGFCVWMKRLEAGVFRVQEQPGYEEITGVDLEELLRGVEFSRIKLRKEVEKRLQEEMKSNSMAA